MATYVNDLRLTELATGEGSGTWGTTTNLNLELIGEALGYGTQDCFATDADATTTVADGATDPARAMYFKVTSSASLTATRTLTIAPNTMTRVMLIENATTGAQSIAISQGSGGNVTIASGQVKMVYLDGAGAGAAVVDALADLELGTITVANLTATTADINGGTIDGATLGGSSQVTITDADMNGGTIDGVVIGGASAAAGTFTTLQADTSLNVDGTVTADGLTVDGTATLGAASTDVFFADSFNSAVRTPASAGHIYLQTYNGAKNLAQFEDNNDVSFYENTGTTPKFFWDASAEALGIGTTSPAALFHADVSGTLPSIAASTVGLFSRTATCDVSIIAGSTNLARVNFGDNSNEDVGQVAYSNNDDSMRFTTNASEAMRIDASGNLSLGTTGTDFESAGRRVLRVEGSTNALISASDGTSFAYFHQKGGTNGVDIWNTANSYMRFGTNNDEKMRIDSSGNLLVGTTTADGGYDESDGGASTTFIGASIGGAASGSAFVSRRAAPLQLNRQANDGDIAVFRKDGTTVGSIESRAGSAIVVNSQSSNGALAVGGTEHYQWSSSAFYPWTDNTKDLGDSGIRWDDVYATNGTIQTSDANEKQDIAELDESERRVAVAAKSLLRKFRWKDSVAEKGDDARIHFGIIAQDLQGAFEAEGLDAGRYAMFIHSTWTDEKTGEERSRMGVRYSELLAFIIAAL